VTTLDVANKPVDIGQLGGQGEPIGGWGTTARVGVGADEAHHQLGLTVGSPTGTSTRPSAAQTC